MNDNGEEDVCKLTSISLTRPECHFLIRILGLLERTSEWEDNTAGQNEQDAFMRNYLCQRIWAALAETPQQPDRLELAELARDIAAPVWEFRDLDPDGFDKWIKTIANRLALFEKEVRKEENG